MKRRAFLQLLGAGVAGMAFDPERALWLPGQKTIFTPPTGGWVPMNVVGLKNIAARMAAEIAKLMPGGRLHDGEKKIGDVVLNSPLGFMGIRATPTTSVFREQLNLAYSGSPNKPRGPQGDHPDTVSMPIDTIREGAEFFAAELRQRGVTDYGLLTLPRGLMGAARGNAEHVSVRALMENPSFVSGYDEDVTMLRFDVLGGGKL